MSDQGDLFEYRPPDPQPRATAALFAFPLARRVDLVRRHGGKMAEIGASDSQLKSVLTRQRSVLLAKGFAEPEVERQVESLRRAILAERDRILRTGGPGAQAR